MLSSFRKSLAWKINPEGGALSCLAFHPDVASRVFNNFRYLIQVYPGAFDMGMEAFKHGEKLRKTLLCHPQAIILYSKNIVFICPFAMNLYPALSPRVPVLDGIGEQVVNYRPQILFRETDGRAISDIHH